MRRCSGSPLPWRLRAAPCRSAVDPDGGLARLTPASAVAGRPRAARGRSSASTLTPAARAVVDGGAAGAARRADPRQPRLHAPIGSRNGPGLAISRRLVVGAAGAALLPLGSEAWAARAEGGPQRLIVILLRGAVDGLNVVVPYAEPAYYDARPTIAVARPGDAGRRAGARRAFRPASGAGAPDAAVARQRASPLSTPPARPTRAARISRRSATSKTARPGAARPRTGG